MACSVSASERTSLDGSSFWRHLAFGAELQKAQALLDGRLGLRIWDGRGDIDVVIQAHEEVQLVVFLGQRVAAQAQVGVADLALEVAFDGLEGHADFGHVLHHDAGEHQLFIERAVAHLRADGGLRLAQEFRQIHS